MNESDLDAEQIALGRAIMEFRRNLPLFATECLQIRTKDSKFEPLVFNTAQKYLHARLEKQRRETGRIRAMVLKGRQQGISTYVAARFYRRASLVPGTNVYILAHEQASTDALFGIVDRYHRHNPLAPVTGIANAKELWFSEIDSRYIVATAGAKAGGRGRTMTLFHGSEAAFWNNASEHFAASVQTVPDLPGTEVILESTANGVSGEFYERWHDAQNGRSDFSPVFIPWFWQKEYTRPPPEGFELSADDNEGLSEIEYANLFQLSDGQMAWRRAKIQTELRTASLFDQEYPATASMAFQTSGEATFINAATVLRARKNKVEGGGPLIFGVDPAGAGGDRFAIAMRRGHKVEKVIWRDKILATEAVEWLDDLIQTMKPALVNIDAGGLGRPIIDFLRARRPEYANLILAVNFGAPSQSKRARPHMPGPKDRRAEMWDRMNEWLTLEAGVDLPDMDELQGDLCSVRRKRNLTNDLQLETKDDMRARGVRSPDLGDSIALTFADINPIVGYYEPTPTSTYGDVDAKPHARYVGFEEDDYYGWQGV